MHPEVLNYVAAVRAVFPSHFTGKRVLEIGALDVNGSPRPFFTDCDYLGIDCHPGPGVDVVCLAHEFPAPEKWYDAIVSTECFEHDPHLEKTLKNIARMIKPGGMFLTTCAGPDRPEHGTRRTEDAGGTWGPDADYYRNISKEFMAEQCNEYFSPFEVQYARGRQDLYAVGFRI